MNGQIDRDAYWEADRQADSQAGRQAMRSEDKTVRYVVVDQRLRDREIILDTIMNILTRYESIQQLQQIVRKIKSIQISFERQDIFQKYIYIFHILHIMRFYIFLRCKNRIMLYVPYDRQQKLSQTCIPLHGQEEFQIYQNIEKMYQNYSCSSRVIS